MAVSKGVGMMYKNWEASVQKGLDVCVLVCVIDD